jgi:hypothetical protein
LAQLHSEHSPVRQVPPSTTTETRTPIGGTIDITIITGTPGSAYQSQHRSTSEVGKRGYCEQSIVSAARR